MLETYIILPIVYLILAFFVTVKVGERAIGTVFEWPVFVIFVAPFILYDWFINQTVMVVLCLDLAEDKTEVVTKRMKRYKKEYEYPYELLHHWRLFLAKFLCGIANSITEDHC